MASPLFEARLIAANRVSDFGGITTSFDFLPGWKHLKHTLDKTNLTTDFLRDTSKQESRTVKYWAKIFNGFEQGRAGVHGWWPDKVDTVFKYNQQFLQLACQRAEEDGNVAAFVGLSRTILEEKIAETQDEQLRGAYTVLLYQLEGQPVPDLSVYNLQLPDTIYFNANTRTMADIPALERGRKMLDEQALASETAYNSCLQTYFEKAADPQIGYHGTNSNIAQVYAARHQRVVEAAVTRKPEMLVHVHEHTLQAVATATTGVNPDLDSQYKTRLAATLEKTKNKYVARVIYEGTKSNTAAIQNYVHAAYDALEDKEIGAGRSNGVETQIKAIHTLVLDGLNNAGNTHAAMNIIGKEVVAHTKAQLATLGDEPGVKDSLAAIARDTLTKAKVGMATVAVDAMEQNGQRVREYFEQMEADIEDKNIGAVGKRTLVPELMNVHEEAIKKLKEKGANVQAEAFKQAIDNIEPVLNRMIDPLQLNALRQFFTPIIAGAGDGYALTIADEVTNGKSRVEDYLGSAYRVMTNKHARTVDPKGQMVPALEAVHTKVCAQLVAKNKDNVRAIVEGSLTLAPTHVELTDEGGKEIVGRALNATLDAYTASYAEKMAFDAQRATAGSTVIPDYVKAQFTALADPRIGAGTPQTVETKLTALHSAVLAKLKENKAYAALRDMDADVLDRSARRIAGESNDSINVALATIARNTITQTADEFAIATSATIKDKGEGIKEYFDQMSGLLQHPGIGAAGRKPLTDELLEAHKKVMDQIKKEKGTQVLSTAFTQVVDQMPTVLIQGADANKLTAMRKYYSTIVEGAGDGYALTTAQQLESGGLGPKNYLGKTYGILGNSLLRSSDPNNKIIASIQSAHQKVCEELAKKGDIAVELLDDSLVLLPGIITTKTTDPEGRQVLADTLQQTIQALSLNGQYAKTKAAQLVGNVAGAQAYAQKLVALIQDPVIGVAGTFPMVEQIIGTIKEDGDKGIRVEGGVAAEILKTINSDAVRIAIEKALREAVIKAHEAQGNEPDPRLHHALHAVLSTTMSDTVEAKAAQIGDVIGNEAKAKAYWDSYIKDLSDEVIGVGGTLKVERQTDELYEKVLDVLAKKDIPITVAFMKAGIDAVFERIEKAHGGKGEGNFQVAAKLLNKVLTLITNSKLTEHVDEIENADGARLASTIDMVRRYFISGASGKPQDEKSDFVVFKREALNAPNGKIEKFFRNIVEAGKLHQTPEMDLAHVAYIAIRERGGQMMLRTGDEKTKPGEGGLETFNLHVETPYRKELGRMVKEGQMPTRSHVIALIGLAKAISPAGVIEALDRDVRINHEIMVSHPHSNAAVRNENGIQLAESEGAKLSGRFYARYLGSGMMHHTELPRAVDDKEYAAMMDRHKVVATSTEKGHKKTEDVPLVDAARTFFNLTGRYNGIDDEVPGIPYLFASEKTIKALGLKVPPKWEKGRKNLASEVMNLFMDIAVHEKYSHTGAVPQRQSMAFLSLDLTGNILKTRLGEEEAEKVEFRKRYVDLLAQIISDQNDTYAPDVKKAALKAVESCLPYFPEEYQKQYVDHIILAMRQNPKLIDEPRGKPDNQLFAALMPLAKQMNEHRYVVGNERDVYRPIANYIYKQLSNYIVGAYAFADDASKKRWLMRGLLGLQAVDCQNSKSLLSKLTLPDSTGFSVPVDSDVKRVLDVLVDCASFSPDGSQTFQRRIGLLGRRIEAVLKAEVADQVNRIHPIPEDRSAWVIKYEKGYTSAKTQLAAAIGDFSKMIEGLQEPPEALTKATDVFAQLTEDVDLQKHLPILDTLRQQVQALITEAKIGEVLTAGDTKLTGALVDRMGQIQKFTTLLEKGQEDMESMSELIQAMGVRTDLPELPDTQVNLVDASGQVSEKVTSRGAYRLIAEALRSHVGAGRTAVHDDTTAQNLLAEFALAANQDASYANAFARVFESVMRDGNKDKRALVQELIEDSGLQADANSIAQLQIGLLKHYIALRNQENANLVAVLEFEGRAETALRATITSQMTTIQNMINAVFANIETALTDESKLGAEVSATARERRRAQLKLWKDEFDNMVTLRRKQLLVRDEVVGKYQEQEKTALLGLEELRREINAEEMKYAKEVTEDKGVIALINALRSASVETQVPWKIEMPTPTDLADALKRGRLTDEQLKEEEERT